MFLLYNIYYRGEFMSILDSKSKIDCFKTEINYIKTLDLVDDFKILIDLIPDYFFEVAASSTGKYHPKFSLGDGGLLRHTKAAVRIAYELLNDDQLLQAISLIYTALDNIAKSKRDITNEYNLFHLIKVALLKSSKLEILGEILKVLRISSLSVNFINYDQVKKKSMKLCK